MRTKTKLNLAVGLLLLLIVTLAVVSAYYTFAIKRDTENILRANYNTLEYSRDMLLALDEMASGDAKAVADFRDHLSAQKRNITETGEGNATGKLERNFTTLVSDPENDSLRKRVRAEIFEIMKLNMGAIKAKSDIAKRTAETANWWIAIGGTLCFLIAFNLMVNLPNNIANPIRELSQSIREIANKNYSQRVHFSNNNEFGDLARSFNTMAEKLQEYNDSNLNKLLVEKKRLETLLDNMHDPVIGLGKDGVIVSANGGALGIIGLKSEDVIGKKAIDVADRNDLVRSLLSDESQTLKIFADGKESYFERENVPISIMPTGEATPVDIGHFIMLRNITAFKELDFAKTNFIATVSHELKTPIASVKLSLKLLENPDNGPLNIVQKELIDGIRDDSERLLKITGELLELSQVETGKIQLSLSESDPSGIVNFAIDAVKNQAEQKQIKLLYTPEPNLPPVHADAEKTSWVLINFLTNAIRYSSQGSGISVETKRSGDNVLFQVIDSGKGIDTRYVPRIFDKYFQVPGSQKSGTGLGLAISKEFIEAQSGAIGMESSLGMGSRFYFTLRTS